jgi:hypothetical protein
MASDSNPSPCVGIESQVNPLSRSVVYLTLNVLDIDGEEKEPPVTASGVIRTLNGLNYLLTALHVLTGREPDNRLKKTYPPNRITIEGFLSRWQCNLYGGANDPFSDAPLYWRHPDGAHLDVGVLPLGSTLRSNCSLDESFFDPAKNEAFRIYVMQSCYVVGFPYGLVDRTDTNFPLPVWKTGHIASEPLTDFQGQPRILIDGLTRPGQSGAPVFVGGGTWGGDVTVTRFVGIYAGREKAISRSVNDGEYWDLGYAFKPRVIEEIFAGNLRNR